MRLLKSVGITALLVVGIRLGIGLATLYVLLPPQVRLAIEAFFLFSILAGLIYFCIWLFEQPAASDHYDN